MRVVTAIEAYRKRPDDIFVFLAGGITNCLNWQDEVLAELESYNTKHMVVFNPRRVDFRNEPGETEKQIAWEFRQLERMDIFSMYFTAGDSVQPICLYELGRNLVRMQERFPGEIKKRVLISIEEGYNRTEDVLMQTKLAIGPGSIIYPTNPKLHAYAIQQAYARLSKEY